MVWCEKTIAILLLALVCFVCSLLLVTFGVVKNCLLKAVLL